MAHMCSTHSLPSFSRKRYCSFVIQPSHQNFMHWAYGLDLEPSYKPETQNLSWNSWSYHPAFLSAKKHLTGLLIQRPTIHHKPLNPNNA